MDPQEAKRIIDRLDNVLSCVRYQNSGADVHTVNNIRNAAILLKEQLEEDPNCLKDELVYNILKNTEKKLVCFFQKKYSH